jgi:hypothetical protein
MSLDQHGSLLVDNHGGGEAVVRGVPSGYTSLYVQTFLLQYCSLLDLQGWHWRRHPTTMPIPTTSPARHLVTSAPTSSTSSTTS